ncbi:MAG: hypothetical protein QOF89_4652 [Acidobacteriota bacterium]|jgi:hypothetical protein|nr:hypothetical protein [Acidobacteriota bacterium]
MADFNEPDTDTPQNAGAPPMGELPSVPDGDETPGLPEESAASLPTEEPTEVAIPGEEVVSPGEEVTPGEEVNLGETVTPGEEVSQGMEVLLAEETPPGEEAHPGEEVNLGERMAATEKETRSAGPKISPEQLAENLRRKEELCVRAEALSESTDWKVTAQAVKALQAEWKTIGPVPQELSTELWQRFRKAGNHFFERRQAHFQDRQKDLEENLRKKEALCVQAEELSSSSDWKVTTEAIKALQAQWKEIGPVPREQAEPLWQRFRKANDEFFERRQVHFAEVDKENKENTRKKEDLCRRAEELCTSTSYKETGEALKALQAEWKAVGPVPRQKSEALWKRFRGAMDQFFARRAAWFEEREKEREERKTEWKDRLRETLTYKQEQLERLRESIVRDDENLTRWRTRLEGLRPGPHADATRAELEGKINEVDARVGTKRTRIVELEKDIQEIEAKL